MHVPGSKMVQSDTLSRRPDHIPEEDTDNEDLVLLPDELFINLINIELAKMIESAATSISIIHSNDLEYWRSSYLTETFFSSQKPIEV